MNLNSNIKQKNKKICIVFMIFTAIAFVGRIILIRFDIDPESNLYVNSNWLILSFDYVITIAVVALYIFSFFIYKRKMDGGIYIETTDYVFQGTQTLVFSSSLTGFILTFSSILQGFYFFRNFPSKNMPFSAYVIEYIRNDTLNFALFFAAIFASVYFFKTAAMNPTIETVPLRPDIMPTESEAETVQQPQFSQGYIFFSFFAVVWSFINIFQCFFDMSKSVNSSIRIYELMSFLFISLYFVAESRLIIGRLEVAKFFTFAYISMLLISLSALPNLILSSFWILQTPTSMMTYAVQIAFLLYIFARVYSQLKYSRFSYMPAGDLMQDQESSRENQENEENIDSVDKLDEDAEQERKQ